MKRQIMYTFAAVSVLGGTAANAYNFEFKNFTNKELVVELLLGGGVDEKPVQITVPAVTKDNSGKRQAGVASKSFDGFFRDIMCLSKNDIKIGEKGQKLKSVGKDLGGIFLTIGRSLSVLVEISSRGVFDDLVGKLTNDENGLTTFMQGTMGPLGHVNFCYKMGSGDELICYDRTFVIVELYEKLTLFTWK